MRSPLAQTPYSRLGTSWMALSLVPHSAASTTGRHVSQVRAPPHRTRAYAAAAPARMSH